MEEKYTLLYMCLKKTHFQEYYLEKIYKQYKIHLWLINFNIFMCQILGNC